MPLTPTDRYRTEHPDLVQAIVGFFDMANAKFSANEMRPRTVLEFLTGYAKSHPGARLQPYSVVEICRRLVRFGYLSEVSTGGFGGVNNSYHCLVRREGVSLEDPSVRRLLDCAVYGTEAVYAHYSPSVIPVVHHGATGLQQIGTCFVGNAHWLLTATHCVHPAAALAIRGIERADLQIARFFRHPNEALDLTCVYFGEPVLGGWPPIPVPQENAPVLEEVIALGYPNVPGYHPTLAAEAATISGRLSVSRGRVASTPQEIFSQAELFLVTARVRGGFSGGPVLDSFGQAVGVISREPAAEGRVGEGHQYDELGYGVAIPSNAIQELIAAIKTASAPELDMGGVEFIDFE